MEEAQREWAPHMTIKAGETLTITRDGKAIWWVTDPRPPNRWSMKQQRVRERRALGSAAGRE